MVMGETDLLKRVTLTIETVNGTDNDPGNALQVTRTLHCTFEGDGQWMVNDTEGMTLHQHYNQTGAILMWLGEHLGIALVGKKK